MPLLKNNAFADDTWLHLGMDEPLPENGAITVPLARLLRDWEVLTRRAAPLGVSSANSVRAEALGPFLPRLALIVLPFPSFSDGRAYSLARQLREDGYRGELRASGNVLPDQLQFMLQVGFDSFAIGSRFPLSAWQAAARRMSLGYQRGLIRPNREADIWSERHSDAAPWPEQPYAG